MPHRLLAGDGMSALQRLNRRTLRAGDPWRNTVPWWLRRGQADMWRWKVARAADRLPRQCWSDLVDWKFGHHLDDPDTPMRDLVRRLPIRFQNATCREDLDRCGSCYCGKLRAPAVTL